MADPVEKFLAKIGPKEKTILIALISRILSGDLKGMDVKKLAGHTDIFRVRKGKFRIIYRKTKDDCVIEEITRRDDQTYKNY